MLNKAALLSCIAALVSGCATINVVDSSASAPGDDESIVVLGVQPVNREVTMWHGTVKDGVFAPTHGLGFAALVGYPTDGYIVGKARAGETIAITSVRIGTPTDHRSGARFTPCNGAKTMVFKVPHGKVVYLGSVDYTFSGTQLQIKYASEPELAQQYVANHFPALKGKVEYIAPEFMKTTDYCTKPTMYVPVYL